MNRSKAISFFIWWYILMSMTYVYIRPVILSWFINHIFFHPILAWWSHGMETLSTLLNISSDILCINSKTLGWTICWKHSQGDGYFICYDVHGESLKWTIAIIAWWLFLFVWHHNSFLIIELYIYHEAGLPSIQMTSCRRYLNQCWHIIKLTTELHI